VIGLEWELVHDEACRWEHVISDHVEEKLVAMLSDPLESPYGNPIPGLEEVGGHASSPDAFRQGVQSLPEALVATTGGSSLLVRRLGEHLQIDAHVMRQLADVGLRPGSVVVAVVTPKGYSLDVRTDGAGTAAATGTVQLPAEVAKHVFVEAIPGVTVPG
jgi:DtxR family Mn-dependent transcriptional regulator